MNEWQNTDWDGTPCTSDAWPFSRDVVTFEVRRAIVQLVRTFGSSMDPSGVEKADLDPTLRYIQAADELQAKIDVVRKDLVAEARARGVEWKVIGQALGIRKSGAHRRFRAGLSQARVQELKNEAFVSWLGSRAAIPHELPYDVSRVLDGATPLERLAFVALQALGSIREIDELLAAVNRDPGNASAALQKACRRIERAIKAVALDHEMWDAMGASWPGRPDTVDQANYHAPPTYLLHTMRLLLFALLHAPDEDTTDVAAFHVFLKHVQQVYATVLLILERPDVGSAIPAPM